MAEAETTTLQTLLGWTELSDAAKEFAGYWSALPKLGDVPRRRDFDPASLPAILPSFVILEVESPESVRFRLAGTSEVERYGQEVTGRNYLDFVPVARRPKAYAAFRNILDYPCGMLAVIYSITACGEPFLNEALGFPVRGQGDQVNLIYFQSNNRPRDLFHDNWADKLERHVAVTRRVFVDIGAGVPTDFSE